MANDLTGGIRNLILAGIGALATTADKSQELLDSLVSRGELTVEQGKVLNEELKRTAQKVKTEAQERVDAVKSEKAEEVSDGIDTANLTLAQKKALRDRLIAELEAAEE